MPVPMIAFLQITDIISQALLPLLFSKVYALYEKYKNILPFFRKDIRILRFLS